MRFCKSYRRILDEHLHALVAQGNHAAYKQLENRYKKAADLLTKELIHSKYSNCGVTPSEITSVCTDNFSYIVKKYDCSMSAFYTFWRRTIELQIADYVNSNYFSDKSKTLVSFISYDEDLSDSLIGLEYIAEIDENNQRMRQIHEIKSVILANKSEFENAEFMMLLLTLDGYSIADFEHTGITSQSTLYLTFNRAIAKLEKILKKEKI